MPTIKVNGVTLYYESHGDGPPLVLIAGLSCDHTMWSEFIAPLAKQFSVLTLDNRAVGQSETPTTPFTVHNMAADVAAVMDALHIKQAHVAGHSLGGMIAQTLALSHPEKINKLVICCSTARATPLMMHIFHTNIKMVQASVPIELCIENMLSWLFSGGYLADPKNTEKEVNRILLNPHFQTVEGYVAQVSAVDGFDITSEIAKISHKTLVLAAEEDVITPVAMSQVIASKIKTSRLVTVPQSGHCVMFETPERLANELKTFLSGT